MSIFVAVGAGFIGSHSCVELLERVYDGSVGMMLSAMAHECKLSKSEIDELYEIIREAREEEK